ncbi:MAG: capsular biosynthesis protein [Anaerolineae bacterium]|nr:capsular biosynthesis protein [Anaerolineae bacterium]
MISHPNPEPVARAVFWGWHSADAAAAVRELRGQGRLEVTAWFGNGPDCTHRLDPFIHQFRLDPVPPGIDLDPGRLAPDELLTFCDMYSRVSRARALPIHELGHVACCYLRFWAALLASGPVTHVFFSSPPHFGVDYLLYLAARHAGVATAFCCQSLFPDRFFYVRTLEDFGRFDEVPEASGRDPDEPPLRIERRFEKQLFYMQGVKMRGKPALASLANDVRRLVTTRASKPMSLAGALQKYREAREFARSYEWLAVDAPDLSVPYVYFALQLQPEMTTSTLGAGYSDQLSALERLSAMVPDGWQIYAKENPKQTGRQRGAAFFRRLAMIPKVTYVAKTVDTYALLQGCRFASTVTGTVGWEAITGGKPVVTFGQPWFALLPGVCRFQPGLTVEKVLQTRIDHVALERALRALLAKTTRGVIDPVYQGIVPGFDPPTNVGRLRSFLERGIEGRLFTTAPTREAA